MKKLVRITGPLVAALVVAACGAESKHASAPQRAAEEAAEEKRDAQKDAQQARADADKARRESQEATRAQNEAEQNARFAGQREAQADLQAREAQSPRAPRSSAAELQASNPDHDRVARSTVAFAANSDQLSADAKAQLDELAKTLRANPQRNNVVIEGYSDDSGAESANVQMSRRRVGEVAHYLESKGVPQERIATKALGSEHPVGKEDSSRGRALNRRVEIVIEPARK